MNLRVDWQIIFVKPEVVAILGQRHGLRHVGPDTTANVCVRWHVIVTEYLQSMGTHFEFLFQSSLPISGLEPNKEEGCLRPFGQVPIQLTVVWSLLIQ